MTERRRSDSGVVRSWAARTTKALSDWRWIPILGKAGLGILALSLLSVLGAGGLQSAGASPEALTVASVVGPAGSVVVSPAGSVVVGPAIVGPADVPDTAHSVDVPASLDCEVDAPRGVTADGRVVLNVASESELRSLPGVGPARAAAIVALRQRLGRYRRVEELLRVRGIGPRSLQKLRPLVVVDVPAPDAE